jgi:gliding motility-associated lipoprotein GldH
VKQLLFVVSIIVVFASCTTLDVYEKTKTFSKHEWNSTDVATFNFEIADTNSLYNMFVVLRHEDGYKYKNIWLDIEAIAPDTTLQIKRNFTLSDNTKWLGNGMSDIVEHRINFNPVPAKLKKGTYKFTLKQAMREDPLQYILQAGIRVEKVKS